MKPINTLDQINDAEAFDRFDNAMEWLEGAKNLTAAAALAGYQYQISPELLLAQYELRTRLRYEAQGIDY